MATWEYVSALLGHIVSANDLSRATNLTLIEEQIRISNKKFSLLGYRTLNQVVASPWYANFMFDILISQVQEEASAKNGFVADRTTLDYYAYYVLLSNDPPKIQEIIKDLFLPRFQNSYDLIYYLPITFDLVDDGYRQTNCTFQRQADAELKMLLKPYPNVIEICAHTQKERLDMALKMLELI